MKNKNESKRKNSSKEKVRMSGISGNNIIQTSRMLSLHEVVLANAKTNRKEAVHTAGEVAVVVEGVEYEPKDLKRFNGSPLHYLIHDSNPISKSIIAFKTLTELYTYLMLQSRLNFFFPLHHIPRNADIQVNFGYAYNTKNYNADEWLNLGWPDSGYDDLSTIPRIRAGVSVLKTWDNCISSVENGVNYITFFADSYYRGISYTIHPFLKIPDLSLFGMNDYASSIFNFNFTNPGPIAIDRGLILDTSGPKGS